MSSALKQAKQLANYNNKLEKENTKLQYQYNKQLAEENRDWQEMMSNSAHQREIKDLKKAGLNPVLSITGGNGASTPSGSAASVSKPNTDMSLTGKVMDMAMAQLNSATALQTTAMQTSNALTIAREQIANAFLMHTTPSGNSYFGQYNAFKNYISDTLTDLFPDHLSISDMLNYIITGKLPESTSTDKPKTKKNKNKPTKLPPFREFKVTNPFNYKPKFEGSYFNPKTDLLELIDVLKSPEMDKYGDSRTATKHYRKRKFWERVKARSYSNSSRR